jgi:hypothetical protein
MRYGRRVRYRADTLPHHLTKQTLWRCALRYAARLGPGRSPSFPLTLFSQNPPSGKYCGICIAFRLPVCFRLIDGETDTTRVWPAIRKRALRKGLKAPGRAFVAGLTIGLFLCMTQLAANAQGRRCPVGQIFCFGKCVDTSSDPANCGGCRIPCKGGQVCTHGTCLTSSPSPALRGAAPPVQRVLPVPLPRR